LMYAQSDYAQSEYEPSIAETTRTVDSTATTIVPSDTQISKNAKAKGGDDQSSEVDVNVDRETFHRPSTPPQGESSSHIVRHEHAAQSIREGTLTLLSGSRIIPWQSYSQLPEDHPVFAIPAAKREKMYTKGIGELSTL